MDLNEKIWLSSLSLSPRVLTIIICLSSPKGESNYFAKVLQRGVAFFQPVFSKGESKSLTVFPKGPDYYFFDFLPPRVRAIIF